MRWSRKQTDARAPEVSAVLSKDTLEQVLKVSFPGLAATVPPGNLLEMQLLGSESAILGAEPCPISWAPSSQSPLPTQALEATAILTPPLPLYIDFACFQILFKKLCSMSSFG